MHVSLKNYLMQNQGGLGQAKRYTNWINTRLSEFHIYILLPSGADHFYYQYQLKYFFRKKIGYL